MQFSVFRPTYEVEWTWILPAISESLGRYLLKST